MHTKLYKEKYKIVCDFCENIIDSGKEMDKHLKYNLVQEKQHTNVKTVSILGEMWGVLKFIMENIIKNF